MTDLTTCALTATCPVSGTDSNTWTSRSDSHNGLLAASYKALWRCRRQVLEVFHAMAPAQKPPFAFVGADLLQHHGLLQSLRNSFCVGPENTQAWAISVLLRLMNGLSPADDLSAKNVHRVMRILLRATSNAAWEKSDGQPATTLDRLICAEIDAITSSAAMPETGSKAGANVWCLRAKQAFRRISFALRFSKRYSAFITLQQDRLAAPTQGMEAPDFIFYCLALNQALSAKHSPSQGIQVVRENLGLHLKELFGQEDSQWQPSLVWAVIKLVLALKFLLSGAPEKALSADCEKFVALCGLWLHAPAWLRSSALSSSSASECSQPHQHACADFDPEKLRMLAARAQHLIWGVCCADTQCIGTGPARPERQDSEDYKRTCQAVSQLWDGCHRADVANLQRISLALYRSAIVISLHGTGPDHQALICRTRSLWVSVNHCFQLRDAAVGFSQELTELLGRFVLSINQCAKTCLPGQLQTEPSIANVLLLEATTGLFAQQYWQDLVAQVADRHTELSQSGSVHEMLAAGLRLLPQPGCLLDDLRMVVGQSGGEAYGYNPATRDCLDEVLIELRMLAEGARVLGVPKIESMARVMTSMYRAVLLNPQLLSVQGTLPLLARAHRRLGYMLDQAAAWQPVDGGADILDRLCTWVDRHVHGVGYGLIMEPESEAGPGALPDAKQGVAEHTNAWQDCRRYNQRLRGLLEKSADLEQARVLLLELLKGQNAVIKRYLSYERHR
jgi:hypothetical protein